MSFYSALNRTASWFEYTAKTSETAPNGVLRLAGVDGHCKSSSSHRDSSSACSLKYTGSAALAIKRKAESLSR